MNRNPWGHIVAVAESILAVLRLQRVYMDRPIRGLRCDVLVQRIPSDALDVMAVLSDLPDERPRPRVVYSRNVIHAANDKERRVRRPSQVKDLRPQRATHMLCSPCFLIVEVVGTKSRLVMI